MRVHITVPMDLRTGDPRPIPEKFDVWAKREVATMVAARFGDGSDVAKMLGVVPAKSGRRKAVTA